MPLVELPLKCFAAGTSCTSERHIVKNLTHAIARTDIGMCERGQCCCNVRHCSISPTTASPSAISLPAKVHFETKKIPN